MKDKFIIFIFWLFLILNAWIGITTFICNLINPELTQMESILRIKKNIVLDFKVE